MIELRFRALAFLGSFLLFQAELILAKLLLPRYGSSAAVWTTCLMFYQGVLLAGYLYARTLSRVRTQRWIIAHGVAVVVSLVFLPFRLVDAPGGPIVSILLCLSLGVGAPLLLLSTTSVLAQAWLARTQHPAGKDPYYLYAMSNVGSLLALVTYPTVVEPMFDSRVQLVAWAVLYGAYALLHLACLRGAGDSGKTLASVPRTPLLIGTRAQWVLLAAGGSALMMGATNAATMDAPVPLLWIVPLTVYLVTFILAFGRKPVTERGVAWLSAVSLTLAVGTLVLVKMHLGLQAAYIALHDLVLFVGCLVAHARLSRSRPADAADLGTYYLDIALGGWLGSVVIAVVIPVALRTLALPYLDYVAAGVLLVAGMLLRDAEHLKVTMRKHRARAAFAFGGLALFGMVLGLGIAQAARRNVEAVRTFYGLNVIKDEGGLRYFMHGNTVHGIENQDGTHRGEPLSYFHRGSPIGQFLSREGYAPGRVAVIGLGAGTLASYAAPGSAWDFYELDPEVDRLARAHFTFIAGSRAHVRVIAGDGRLTLSEAPDATYDLIVLDAFASDFLPTHLVTREALALYHRKLNRDGILLFNISNRIVDLRAVLGRLAVDAGLVAVLGIGLEPPPPEVAAGKAASLWLALGTQGQAQDLLQSGWRRVELSPDVMARRPWTDTYINYFHAL